MSALHRAFAPLVTLAVTAGLTTGLTVEAAAADPAPALFVSEINADNGSHTFVDADGEERSGAQDNFEFFEIANTTDTAIDLGAAGYSLAYGTTLLAIDPATPAVVPAGGSLALWLRYQAGQADGHSSGSPNSFLFDDADFRNHHGAAADLPVVHVTGQNGMANGGGRTLSILQAGTTVSSSTYASGEVAADLSAHFTAPAVGETAAVIHTAKGVPSPGSLAEGQLGGGSSDPAPEPDPEPEPIAADWDLFVSEINPDNVGYDDFEYFEVTNTTDADLDLTEAQVGFRYIYDDAESHANDRALTIPDDVVVPAGTTTVFWLRYTTGTVDSFARTEADFRAHHGMGDDVAVHEVTGQAGFANSGDRGVQVVRAGQAVNWSFYPTGSVGTDASAHFQVAAQGRSAHLFASAATRTPGAVDAEQSVPHQSGTDPDPEPEPEPTVPVQGPPPAVDPDLNAPILQVTEVAPDTTNVDGADGYEFIEVYNSSDQPVDFADFVINYLYIDANQVQTNATLWPAVPHDPVIEPGQTMVLWIKNDANGDLVAADFNAHFGSRLVAGENLVEIASGGMANGGLRGIQVMTNTGHDVSRAYYFNNDQTVPDQPIQYRWVDGAVQELTGTGTATPGYAAPDQVPAGLVESPVGTNAPQVTDRTQVDTEGLTLDFLVTDDHQVRTVELTLTSNVEGDSTSRQLQFGDADTYRYEIPAVDLYGKRWVDYSLTVRDGEHTTTYGPERVPLVEGEADNLRLNRADGDFVNGESRVAATTDGDPSELRLAIDGVEVAAPTPALEAAPMFAFEATSTDAFFRNGVLLDDEVLHVFDEGFYDATETVSTEVPVERVELGKELTIGIHAGTKAHPGADPDENNDDFSAMSPRLVLPDGRVLRPVRCAGAGEGLAETERPCPADPTSRIAFSDANQVYFLATFEIPADAFDSITHQWDTTSVADGEHTVTATLGDQTRARTLRVDNTAPTVETTVADGSTQRGAFTIDASVTDAGAGVPEGAVTAKLDGEPIELPHETSSVTLPAGDHVLEVTAVDNLGNTRVTTVGFRTPVEQPTTELDAPAAGDEVTAGDVTLKATPSDPEGDALDVDFRRGFTFDIADDEVTAISGTTSDTTLLDRSALRTTEGLEQVTSATEFPFQLFTVDVPADAGDDVTARVHWEGSANADAKVLMYVLDHGAQAWRKVDQHLTTGGAATEFTLEAMVPASGLVKEGGLTVLVQHSEGFSTTGQSSRGDTVEPFHADATPRGEYDFTIGVMSDTQYYNSTPEFHPHQLAINEFFLAQREKLNLQYVIHTGDIVDDASVPAQWERANPAYQLFDDAGLPYGVLAGNHDVGHHDNDYTEYSRHFGEARFAGNPWYAGTHLDNRGHYDLISANGVDFLMLYMGWGAGDDQIAWMNEVISRHPERKVWINLHEYILTTGGMGPIAQRVNDEVVATNPNVFAVSSGHYHDAHTRTDSFDDDGDGVDDRTVYSMLFDYQGLPEGGQGFLRLLHFDNEAAKIVVRTYSPSLAKFNSDDPSLDPISQEFEIPYADFSMTPQVKRLTGTDFRVDLLTTEAIGSVTGVESGSQVEAIWTVEPGEHGWYVETRDEHGAVYHSPVRTFTAVAGEPQPDLEFTATPAPTIAGEPRVGETLTAEPGQWAPVDPEITFTHQWLADGEPIVGAEAATLELTEEHEGLAISVQVTGSQEGYVDAIVVSQPTAAVVAADVDPELPSVTGKKPKVKGKIRVGKRLKAVTSGWTDGAVLSHQWLADGREIAGATGRRLVLTKALRGRRISVRVTGELADHTALTLTSSARGPVRKGKLVGPKPRIKGKPEVSKRLKAVLGSWTPGTKLKVRWFAGTKRVGKGRTLRLTRALGGKRIRVRVVANQSGYAKTTKRSAKVRVRR